MRGAACRQYAPGGLPLMPTSCRRRGGDAVEAAREIPRRAHFIEAGGRALEQELHVSRRIEVIRLGSGGVDETYAAIVEGVDQVDEPARHLAPGRSEHRNGIDQNGMKVVGDMQKVVRSERPLAQLAEREARHAHGSERHANLVALDLQLDRRAGMLAVSSLQRRSIWALARTSAGVK